MAIPCSGPKDGEALRDFFESLAFPLDEVGDLYNEAHRHGEAVVIHAFCAHFRSILKRLSQELERELGREVFVCTYQNRQEVWGVRLGEKEVCHG